MDCLFDAVKGLPEYRLWEDAVCNRGSENFSRGFRLRRRLILPAFLRIRVKLYISQPTSWRRPGAVLILSSCTGTETAAL